MSEQFATLKNFIEQNIRYKDWVFFVGQNGDHCYVQVQFMAADNVDPTKIAKQHGRKWQLSVWMTPTEIVQTCWAAVQRAELHEAAERFKYKGADIFNTHLSADALVPLCEKGCYEHRGEKN